MNRRGMVKTVLAACAALLMPWRKANAGQVVPIRDPSIVVEVPWKRLYEGPTARIRRLLKGMPPQFVQDARSKLLELCLDIESYHSVVASIERFGPVHILWFASASDKAAVPQMSLVGTVLVDKVTADSLDDNTLSKYLMDAFLVTVDYRHPHGKLVWIKCGHGPDVKTIEGFTLPSYAQVVVSDNVHTFGRYGM